MILNISPFVSQNKFKFLDSVEVGLNLKNLKPNNFEKVEGRKTKQEQEYKFDYSCVLVPFSPSFKEDFIQESEKFVGPLDFSGKGLELEPHLTLKYGLTTDDISEVKDLVCNFGELNFTTHFVSCFFGEEKKKDYDVLYLSVLNSSKSLNRLNHLLGYLSNVDETEIFTPHITIAYVQKGKGYKYLGKPFSLSFQAIVSDEIIFSDRNGVQNLISLVQC